MIRRKGVPSKKRKGERHPHPVAILLYTRRFWYLLLIPALRGLYYGLLAGPDSWTDTLWMDLLAIGGVLAFGWFCWLGVRYHLEGKELVLRQGLLFRRERRIPLDRVHGLALRAPFALRPFSLFFLSLKTLGGRAETPDFSLLLSRGQAKELAEAASLSTSPSPSWGYRPRPRHGALFSLLCSNSLGGVLLLGALLSRGGSLVGRQLEQQFAGALEEAAQRLAAGVPIAAAAASLLLLAGWMVGFLNSLARHYRMQVCRWNGCLQIAAGLFSRRQYRLREKRVAAVAIRQPLPALLFKRETLWLHWAGFKEKKEGLQALLLASPRKETSHFLKELLPSFCLPPSLSEQPGGLLRGKERKRRLEETPLRPPLRALPRYIGLPLGLTLLPPLTAGVLCLLWPSLEGVLRFSGWLAAIPAAVSFFCALVGFFRAGLWLEERVLALCSPRRFSFETLLVPLEQIKQVRIRRSFWQRMGQECDLFLSFGQDRWETAHLKSVPFTLLKARLEKEGMLPSI